MPTKIPWTDERWNPVLGCDPESEGCLHCYAARFAHRGLCEAHRGLTVVGPHGPRFNGTIRLLPERLAEPLAWRRPRRTFVPSMGDLFCQDVPFPYVAAVWAVMAAARSHTFQVLTKHPDRLHEFLEWIVGEGSKGYVWQSLYSYAKEQGVFCDRLVEKMTSPWPWPLPNVWLGATVESPKYLHRVDTLRECSATVRFLSCEPLLDRLDLAEALGTEEIHWVIAGGESGPKARPCAIEWIEEIVEQCDKHGVACFVKQLGSLIVSEERAAETVEEAQDLCGPDKQDRWLWYGRLENRSGADPEEWPEHLNVRQYPDEASGVTSDEQ